MVLVHILSVGMERNLGKSRLAWFFFSDEQLAVPHQWVVLVDAGHCVTGLYLSWLTGIEESAVCEMALQKQFSSEGQGTCGCHFTEMVLLLLAVLSPAANAKSENARWSLVHFSSSLPKYISWTSFQYCLLLSTSVKFWICTLGFYLWLRALLRFRF